jgi:hypothetical protein
LLVKLKNKVGHLEGKNQGYTTRWQKIAKIYYTILQVPHFSSHIKFKNNLNDLKGEFTFATIKILLLAIRD